MKEKSKMSINNYLEKDYKKLIRDYKIHKIKSNKNLFTKKLRIGGFIIGHWNLGEVLKRKGKVALVTGFSLSGRLHISNKKPIDIALSINEKENKLFIPISDTESILTRRSPKDINRDFNLFLKDLKKMGVDLLDSKVYLHSKNREVQSLVLQIIKKLKSSDFEKIYGKKINLAEIFAISNMMADIFYPSILGYKKIIVILGVDEIRHAQLARIIAHRFGLPSPAFLFSRILRGLKGIKMSKSKPEENILISDSPKIAKEKLIHFCIKRKFRDETDELPYQIAVWKLNMPAKKVDLKFKELNYKDFVRYIADNLEEYFRNGFR